MHYEKVNVSLSNAPQFHLYEMLRYYTTSYYNCIIIVQDVVRCAVM